MRTKSFCAGAVGLLVACGAAAGVASAQTTTGTFTGGDAGEGLDLDGTFVHAANVLGPPAGQVRDANFNGETGVAFPNWTAQIANWIDTEYGSTTNDENLEQAMDSIRHGPTGGVGQIEMAVVQGQQYQLQLLFQEGCCNRGFDVEVEGALIADNFSTGPTTTTQGVFVRHLFTAGDNTLNVALNGPAGGFPDANPIINAVTLELVPEPSALGLIALGGLALLRRRK